MGEEMMEDLFLRVFTVSAAVSLLLLPLLLGRRWMEGRYSPRTRWGVWLALALVLLLAPWAPKSLSPVVVEAPDYTLTLPRPAPERAPEAPVVQPVSPAGGQSQAETPARPDLPSSGQAQAPAPAGTDLGPALPADPVTPEAGETLSLTGVCAGVWLLGVAAVLLWQGGKYLLVRRRLLRGAQPVAGLEPYAAELGLEGEVAFCHSEAVPGPMTLGVFRPVVLFPARDLAEAALRHELYHVKRHDVAYKLLLLWACALHWFNPLVWLLYRAADRDLEACCDAAVVAGRDSGYKRSYGELLLSAAGAGKNLPFTTSFGGGAEQMRARLTQIFRPGRQSRALVCAVLALAVVLGSLVACRQGTGELADGVYCSPYANVVWPLGEADAEGEDYTSIQLSLLNYDEIDGPHGKPLGEYTLPLSKDLMLRRSGREEDQSAGEWGTQAWQREVFELLRWPVYRNLYDPNMVDYLVVTVKGGEITRLSWAWVRQDGTLYINDARRFTLQLPESWAGNYTIEEQGQEVRFLYQENREPLMTLHVMSQAGGQEGWQLLGINNWYVYAHLPAGEEDTPWGELREEMREQLAGNSGFSWIEGGLPPQKGYTDEHYGFTLRLPESWAGRYEVEQGRDEYGLFWRFSQRSGDGSRGGELFTLDQRSLWRDEEAPELDAAQGRGVLGVRDRGDYWEVYRITSPTWTSEHWEGYEEMKDDVGRITPADFGFFAEAREPLTEDTMPSLDYYDPQREFLLYHTLDTAYFYYGGTIEEFHAARDGAGRVLWRCDVSRDETTVYLSSAREDTADREERLYTWDIAEKTLRLVDSLPAGVDHMGHGDSGELYQAGFLSSTSLRSNVIQARDGTLVGLFVNRQVGKTVDYLRLCRRKDGAYLEGTPFLTPERIPGPRAYTEPDWGFTLHLPASLEGQYYVERAGNYWSFYDKTQAYGSGFLFGLWAEDTEAFRASGSTSTVLGEKGGITYLSVCPSEGMEGMPKERQEVYSAMIRDMSELDESSLDLSGVTRSSGYLWPLPYVRYGNDVLLSEEDNTLKLLSPQGVTVQSVSGGRVVDVRADPLTENWRVTVANSDGRYSEYGHLEEVQVAEGDKVEKGRVMGRAGQEEGLCWLTYRLLEGRDLRRAQAINPWSAEYRTDDFLPVTRDSLTLAGDPAVEQALEAALRGETPFYNVETEELCYANALPDSDGQPVTVYRFARLDMDRDTIPEIVLWLQRGEDVYLLGSIVLHYQNGMVYGYPMGYRSLDPQTLKTDGTYAWSGGASNWGWGRMNFQTGKTDNISWVEGENYYVDGRPAAREAFYEAYDRREAKPDVEWDAFDGGM